LTNLNTEGRAKLLDNTMKQNLMFSK